MADGYVKLQVSGTFQDRCGQVEPHRTYRCFNPDTKACIISQVGWVITEGTPPDIADIGKQDTGKNIIYRKPELKAPLKHAVASYRPVLFIEGRYAVTLKTSQGRGTPQEKTVFNGTILSPQRLDKTTTKLACHNPVIGQPMVTYQTHLRLIVVKL
jgi:hypothetical protein